MLPAALELLHRETLTVDQLAARLDISPALARGLVDQLARHGRTAPLRSDPGAACANCALAGDTGTCLPSVRCEPSRKLKRDSRKR